MIAGNRIQQVKDCNVIFGTKFDDYTFVIEGVKCIS